MSKVYNEMSERQFAGMVRGKKAIVLYRTGTDVDKQNDVVAQRAMLNVIRQRLPVEKGFTTPKIIGLGRFGFAKTGGWEVDSSMTQLGHPEHWVTASRGYYALSPKTIFLFPKDDRAFESQYVSKFQSAFGVQVNDADQVAMSESKENKTRFRSYLDEVLRRGK
jgi:hypothetical protein